MSSVIDKAKVSGITAVFTTIVAALGGYPFFLYAGLGMFVFTLMIQHGALKFKIVGSTVLAIIYLIFTHGVGFK